MDHVADKVAVITGGASGIGFAMARRFGAAGMKLVLGDVEEAALAESAAELRGAGHDVTTFVCDVSDPAQIEALAGCAMEAHGAVHVLCNNAGVGAGGLVRDVSLQDWEWVLGVNLWGVIYGVRTFLPIIEASGGGHVVNTASVAGLFSAPFMGPYNVSKFGVVTLSETLFHEMRMTNSGIGVSVLCPAWVRTRIAESHRNHPNQLDQTSQDAAAADPGMTNLLRDVIANGMDPDDVADKVLNAITSNTFYILTHDDSAAAVTARANAIAEGGDPVFFMPQ
jgi:NAD(P)-dependent dehydrogenase (short-subunit alcohol dehydrogenase family)